MEIQGSGKIENNECALIFAKDDFSDIYDSWKQWFWGYNRH